ncbi:hypothetical protein ACHAXN_003878 [Cyclotella atomus]
MDATRTNRKTIKLMAMVLSLCSSSSPTAAFAPSQISPVKEISTTQLHHWATRLDRRFEKPDEIQSDENAESNLQIQRLHEVTRRSIISTAIIGTTLTTLLSALPANADFAPGGTLLDRTVSVTYGNGEASPSRRLDNSNVLFNQDYYYKFGAAAQWIEPGTTEFPKSMPFAPSQQRYDALKKYGSRIKIAADEIVKIGSAESSADIPDATDPVYQLRAFGLLANSFLATENTGTTNELMLARWYINEIYLRIGDTKSALEKGDAKEAKACYGYTKKSLNSYLTLLNRVITSKVGDPFGYI